MNVIVGQSFWIGSMDFLQEVWNGYGQRHVWMETLLDDIQQLEEKLTEGIQEFKNEKYVVVLQVPLLDNKQLL